MAKSKITDFNDQIAEKLKRAYYAIEKNTVGCYKKIEKTVTGGYKKIENAFVERYLAYDGESIEEAKQRIKK